MKKNNNSQRLISRTAVATALGTFVLLTYLAWLVTPHIARATTTPASPVLPKPSFAALAANSIGLTPVEAMTSGDFSQLLPGALIYDPATYNAATGVRQAFPGNVIPKARFDPTGAKLASFYPTPNKPGLATNYLSNPTANQNLDRFDVKVDHTFSEKDSVYTRFSYQKTVTPASPALPAPAYGGAGMRTDLSASWGSSAKHRGSAMNASTTA
jgi:hypothetical protein